MFSGNRLLTYAIRKYKVGAVSVLIGMAALAFAGGQVVKAEDIQPRAVQQVRFKYVTDTELTAEQKKQIQPQLRERQVGSMIPTIWFIGARRVRVSQA